MSRRQRDRSEERMNWEEHLIVGQNVRCFEIWDTVHMVGDVGSWVDIYGRNNF